MNDRCECGSEWNSFGVCIKEKIMEDWKNPVDDTVPVAENAPPVDEPWKLTETPEVIRVENGFIIQFKSKTYVARVQEDVDKLLEEFRYEV